ncbi:MAG: hypothetical protein PHD95_01650 [Candidatus ainarchaeum sp.]|nr:hypothetical protein [Candidatus ainarchaeum sp.]
MILFSFFGQQVFAANPECSGISIDTYTIRVLVGNSSIESFSIRNSNSERFFVDSAVAYDSSPNFDVQTNSYDREILSESTGTINVKVTGKIFNEEQQERGFLELRGHFLSGKTCSLQDIGKKSFSVIIEKKPVETAPESIIILPGWRGNLSNYCGNIDFFAPSKIEIQGNSGQFELTIDNKSEYRTTIRISAKNSSANPSLISVPKKSRITETIEIQTNSGQTEIEYLIENSVCSFTRKTTVSTVQTQTLAESIAISTIVPDTNGTGYKLAVSLQNKTGKPISGSLALNLPGDWQAEGTKEIELNAFETKTAIFNISPKEELKNNFTGNVSFNSNSETIFTQFELKPKQKTGIPAIAGTMLALLGSNIWAGLLVVFIILVAILFLLANYSRKQSKVLS